MSAKGWDGPGGVCRALGNISVIRHRWDQSRKALCGGTEKKSKHNCGLCRKGGELQRDSNVGGSTVYFCPCCFIFFSTNAKFCQPHETQHTSPWALLQLWHLLLCFGRIPPNIPVQRGELFPPMLSSPLPRYTRILSGDPAQQGSEVRDTSPESTDRSSHSATLC